MLEIAGGIALGMILGVIGLFAFLFILARILDN